MHPKDINSKVSGMKIPKILKEPESERVVQEGSTEVKEKLQSLELSDFDKDFTNIPPPVQHEVSIKSEPVAYDLNQNANVLMAPTSPPVQLYPTSKVIDFL